MSEAYHDYLKSEYWQAVSKAVKGRAGWKCQLCNSQHDLCAHHRTYDHRGSELNHLDDLVCLCRRCHEIFHGKAKIKEPHKHKGMSKRESYVYDHHADMPPGDGDITLTLELINRTRTQVYGFTHATLRAYGLSRPLEKGWVYRLIDTVVSRGRYFEALKGRQLYNSGKLARDK